MILLFLVTVNYSSLIQITHYIYFLIVTMRVSSSNHSLNSLCYLIGGHSLATTQRIFAKQSKKSLKFKSRQLKHTDVDKRPFDGANVLKKKHV